MLNPACRTNGETTSVKHASKWFIWKRNLRMQFQPNTWVSSPTWNTFIMDIFPNVCIHFPQTQFIYIVISITSSNASECFLRDSTNSLAPVPQPLLPFPRAELCQHRSRCFGDDYKALSMSSFQRNRNIRNIARKNKSPLYSALLTRLRRMPGGVGSERLLSPRGLIAWRGIELREVLGPTGGFRACRRF